MAVTEQRSGVLDADPPPRVEAGVIRGLYADWAAERRAGRREGLPGGTLRPSLSVMRRTFSDPLGLLLEHRRRYGPVFTIRHGPQAVVWAISATANHQMLVSEADAFSWREGRFVDLWPLLGDGLLNIDGPFHDGVRRLLVGAFHHDRVAAVADTMVAEGVIAVERLVPGQAFDLYAWARQLALRIALRALLGIERAGDDEQALAHAFERALRFHGLAVPLQMMRGPGTPHARVLRARAELDRRLYDEIRARRRRDDPGAGVLGLLLACTDGDGAPLDEAIVRDQTTTLLFAGHDTTTATLTFLAYELARTPVAAAAVRAELASVVGDRDPAASELDGRTLPVLERTIDETLRMYPPAWVGPRRSTRPVVIDGVALPAGVGVQYSSWATHHLEELYPSPEVFDPDRFRPGGPVSQLPKGAYIPFGGGTRICIGKRFGQYELRALASVLLRRLTLELAPGEHLQVAVAPTLGPKGGMRFVARAVGQ
ncbi:MAG: cytochrome P450 [Solirubrobacteraceae bacterium]